MAPVENQKTNIESIIPPDARDRLIDLQKMIESSKNIDTSKKTVFAMLDTLAGDHPEFKQYYEDIKEYIRFEQAKNVKAIRAEVQAQQDQLRSYSSSHTRSVSSGEEKTGKTYNISMPDRTNQGVDAAGRPTADYGKTIAGNSEGESFDKASVERGRQLLSQIPSGSVDTMMPTPEQGKDGGQKLIQMLNTPVDVKTLKTAVEVIENQADVEQKVMHASLILAQLRTQQYEIMLGSNNSISVVQNIGGKYENNIDFTSVLQSAKIDGNVWQQAMIVSSPIFTQYLETRTDTQGNLKDPNMKSEDFIKYLVNKYRLSQPLKMSEIQDIKRDPSIDPRDKSILIARVNGGISEESTIHTSARLANGLSEYVQSPVVQAGLAKFMNNNPALIQALNQSGVQTSGESYGEHYEKWHGAKAEWRDKKDVGQFLSNAMAKNPGGAFAMYALLVGLITWWGGKDGKFGRFFLAAVALPFAPAMAGGIKDFMYGDDPEGGKKMARAVQGWVDKMMGGESGDVKSYFEKMISPDYPEKQQRIDFANRSNPNKQFSSYREHVAALSGPLLDKNIYGLFFSTDPSEQLRSNEQNLPTGFQGEKIHRQTMKELLRQLILGDSSNPQDKKYMNLNVIDQSTIDTWLQSKNLDQNKMTTMTLRDLISHLARNPSK